MQGADGLQRWRCGGSSEGKVEFADGGRVGLIGERGREAAGDGGGVERVVGSTEK